MAHSVKLAPCQVDYLNLVRALAAQIVLVGHSTAYFLAGHDRGGRWEQFGVLVFFLLSGFLIALSVRQKRDRSDYRFGHYVIDRFCRIFSAYLPALVLVALVDSLMHDLPAYPYAASSTPLQWLGNLVMLQEFPVFQILRRLGSPDRPWFIEAFGSGRPFWTVAIEWWIYLTFGYLAFFVTRLRRLAVRDLLILALVGIVPIYNAMGGVGQCLSFVWATGAAAAWAQDRLMRRGGPQALPGRGRWAWFLTVGILLSAMLLAGRAFVTDTRIYDLQFAVFTAGILFGGFFLLGVAPVTVPRFVSRAIDRIADYSYSLYLIHYTVLMWFAVHRPSPTHHDVGTFVEILVIANVGAWVFWFLFERHYHRLAALAKGLIDRRSQSRTLPADA
ncbi:acyltransferase [Aliidongia dinghuensis]|uniref:Acyltransferase n=1 Tax=Aliidongia dinghuensis TaxID=1867774 RepID=A0A8J2YPR8_9PROT|nr:acyltransferase [Aliidongia dinghuensis]GGE99214.1 acyltransferase [Aliidongia dinghuensis]